MSQQPTDVTKPPAGQAWLDAAGKLAAPIIAWFSAIRVGGAQGGVPTGAEMLWRATAAPVGFLFEQGQIVNRADYPDLWSWVQSGGAPLVTDATWLAGAFGSFSSGNGATTFRLPDGRGRGPLGAGAGSGGLTNRALGSVGGAETHTLTIGEMPSHSHDFNAAAAGAAVLPVVSGAWGPTWYQTAPAGGGGAHNNMQPWFASNWIIKT